MKRRGEWVRDVLQNEPDRLRLAAKPPQHRRVGVAAIVELRDRPPDLRFQSRAHPRLVVDDARNGLEADTGQRGHIEHGRATRDRGGGFFDNEISPFSDNKSQGCYNARAALDKTFLTTLSSAHQLLHAYPEDRCFSRSRTSLGGRWRRRVLAAQSCSMDSRRRHEDLGRAGATEVAGFAAITRERRGSPLHEARKGSEHRSVKVLVGILVMGLIACASLAATASGAPRPRRSASRSSPTRRCRTSHRSPRRCSRRRPGSR